jgi:spermidine/putrescine transport system substrate-binding protein
MKKILTLGFLILILSSLCLTLVACNDETEGEEDLGNTITLNVYNWGEYISDGSLDSYDTNAEFEKYCKEVLGKNVKVVYTTYATNEDMYAKITSGAGTYDIIIPSDYMIQKLREEDMLYAFNPAENIPNYAYIQDTYKNLFYDEENLYSVPYTYGKVGIIYNKTMLKEEDLAKIEAGEGSWSLLFDEDYRGKILQFNNPRDAFGVAMLREGLSVNTTSREDWEKAYRALNAQDCIYLMDEIYNKMENSTAAIAAYYAGDCLVMMQENEDLDFYYPLEGTNIYIDSMCIPKSSKNPGAAELFINYMLDPDIATANANYICYASPSASVRNHPYYDYSLENDERYYNYLYRLPDTYAENPELMQFYHLLDNDTQKRLNDLWARLGVDPGEGGNYVGTYVFLGIVVALIVSFSAYSIYDAVQKHRRAKRIKHQRR